MSSAVVAAAGLDGPWQLALHSSSDDLGLGLVPLLRAGEATAGAPPRIAAHPLGRRLSNDLLGCVEQLLPACQWGRLGRLAVATGPGGFTGTRLTVVFARTLAQQLAIPLGTVGDERFWLVQELPRRGVVAGCYGVDAQALGGMAEWEAPRLYARASDLPPGERLEARVEVAADVSQLLRLSALAAGAGAAAPWSTVLPLYPTSPVGPS
jgi:hypothetical protein